MSRMQAAAFPSYEAWVEATAKVLDRRRARGFTPEEEAQLRAFYHQGLSPLATAHRIAYPPPPPRPEHDPEGAPPATPVLETDPEE